MSSKSVPVLALAAALICSSVHANEPFAAGGLVLDPAAPIVVAQQDVYLSIREVRVSYVYESDAAQTVAMSFPMPIVPIDGGPDNLGGFQLEEGSDHTNYAAASIKVGGQKIEPTVREFAYFNGVDITAELTALGIPVYVGDGELKAALAGVDAAKVADLVQREIIYLDSYGDPQNVNWQYQSVLEWTQDFAAGVTEAEISYTPMNGYPDDVHNQYFGEGEDIYVAEAREAYCIDDALLKALNKKRTAGSYFELVWLDFAPSAEERARPVEEFSLVVDKQDTADWSDDMDYVAFCPVDSKKIAPTQFQWTATDFTPRDFKLVYYADTSDPSV
jgi:hypothetical protein